MTTNLKNTHHLNKLKKILNHCLIFNKNKWINNLRIIMKIYLFNLEIKSKEPVYKDPICQLLEMLSTCKSSTFFSNLQTLTLIDLNPKINAHILWYIQQSLKTKTSSNKMMITYLWHFTAPQIIPLEVKIMKMKDK